MAKAAPAKSQSAPERSPSDEAILWAAKLDGLSPTEQRVLLTLAILVISRNKDGPGWIAYPSLTQLAEKAGVDRRSVSRSIAELMKRGFVTRVGGNVRGDTTVYTLTGIQKGQARGIKPLGAEMHQRENAPRGVLAHKSKESSLSNTQSLNLNISSSSSSKPDDEVIDSQKPEPSEQIRETAHYVARVREAYVTNPATPRRFTLQDEHTALTWCGRGVPLDRIKAALWLGVGRRGKPKTGQAPIGSLAYFADIVEELGRDPQPPGYIAYMRSRVLAIYGERKFWPIEQPPVRAGPG